MDDVQKQLLIDYQMTFGSDHGMRVLEDLQKWSGYDDRIIPVGIDGLVGAISDLGRRDMFLHIKDKLETRPDKEIQETAEGEAEDATE